MQDVADYVGVSRATVSRVLNNHPNVTEDVRQRVRAAMTALKYAPNRQARRLRTNSSDVVGLLIPDIQNPVFISAVRGIEDELYDHQMTLLLCNTDDDRDRQQRYLRLMQEEQVAGLIIAATHPSDGPLLREISEAGTPIVLLDRLVDHFAADTVKVDNEAGASMAVRHLINLGYQRIAMIAGLQHITAGRERTEGYREAFASYGLPVDEQLIRYGDFKTSSGMRLTSEFMASAAPPDAIFVTNSLMTLGAMRTLHRLGYRIPDDVALVGFDDAPSFEDLNPPLTTIAQPEYEMGREAAHLLLRRIEKPNANFRTVVLQPQLIVRISCGATVFNR